MSNSRFCDPMVDFAFKRIFGSEQYKEATIGLINSFITDRKVREVNFINTEIQGLAEEDRKSCVDVLCTGEDGTRFIIEMQVVKQDHFRERTVLYASTLIAHFAEKGSRWDYRLKPTCVISVLDFELPHTEGTSPNDSCIYHYASREETNGELLPGAPEFVFLEPKRFKKSSGELAGYREKWLYLLKTSKNLDVIPNEFIKEGCFQAYFNGSETAKFTKEERMEYDKAMITKTDIEYGKEYARKEGFKEGKLEVARKMLAGGFDVKTISELTGLTPGEISELK